MTNGDIWSVDIGDNTNIDIDPNIELLSYHRVGYHKWRGSRLYDHRARSSKAEAASSKRNLELNINITWKSSKISLVPWWNSVTTSKHEHAVMLTSIEKMETLNKFKRDTECTLMSGGAPLIQGNPRALSCWRQRCVCKYDIFIYLIHFIYLIYLLFTIWDDIHLPGEGAEGSHCWPLISTWTILS